MNTLRVTLCLTVLTATCCCRAADDWINRSVTYAGAQITIVLPAAINRDDPAHDDWLRKFMRPEDEFIAGIYSTNPSYYAAIEAKFKTKGLTLTPEQFAITRTSIEKSAEPSSDLNREILRKIEAHTKAVAEKEDQEWIKNAIGGTVLIGAFDQSPSHISILMLTAYDMPDGSAKKRMLVTGTNTLLLIHGKVIQLLFYEPFIDQESYQHIKSVTKEAIRRTLAANK